MQSQSKDLTLTQSLTVETVVGMLTRVKSHYPNSGHSKETLRDVAEDWFHTFNGKLTEKAFIEAVNEARRNSRYFPLEKDVFEAAGQIRQLSIEKCNTCTYNLSKNGCDNLKKPDFDPVLCGSYLNSKEHVG